MTETYVPTVPQDEKQESYQDADAKSFSLFIGTDRVPIVRKDIELYPQDYAMLLYNVLSPSECLHYIQTSEDLGLKPSGYQTHYRNNDRVIATSEQVSQIMWDRIKEHVKPIQLTKEEKCRVGPPYFNMEGDWEPRGMNVLWRLCKYHPSGHFGPHFDGAFVKDDNHRSMKTFMIYLNNEFTGGTTNFVTEDQRLFKDSNGKFIAEEKNILLKIKPEPGMAIIFNHELLHEGGELLDGLKYIMRSEIMYERTGEIPLKDPKEMKAIEFVKEAQRLETEGKPMEAVEFYRKAFRLWPDLEKFV